jgi:hypothetical protein
MHGVVQDTLKKCFFRQLVVREVESKQRLWVISSSFSHEYDPGLGFYARPTFTGSSGLRRMWRAVESSCDV